MIFTCSHCGKPIQGLSITIDNEILHRECEGLRIKPISLELNDAIAEIQDINKFFLESTKVYMMIPKEMFND